MPVQIELAETLRLVEQGAQLLDVLSRKEYEESHLPGAIHIPLQELDEASVAALDRGRPVIAYCYDYE
jgi:rhodanese-related sulfurtransferase